MDADGTRIRVCNDAALDQTIAYPVRPTRAAGAWTDDETPRVPEADVRASLPGWFFLERAETSPLGEIWVVQSPWGDRQRAHLVPPHLAANLQRFLNRVPHLKHPSLLPIRLAPQSVRMLLSPWRGGTLVDRIVECRHAGLVGIPTAEMLGYVRELARALDELRQITGMGHDGLTPRCIFLHEDRVRVAGFGCVEILGKDDCRLLVPDPNFAPPECLRGRAYRTTDQASLAMIYAAMTTGILARGAVPDSPVLSLREREVLSRAMHAQPSMRFPDCVSFVHALEESAGEHRRMQPLLGPSWVESQSGTILTSIADFARELYLRGKRSHFETAPAPESRQALRHGLTSSLPIKLVAHRLELYRSHVGGVWLYQEPGHGLMEIQNPVRLWRRWTAGVTGFRMRLKWTKSGCGTAVWARIVPFGGTIQNAGRRLEERGKVLLRELRRILFALPEQRHADRIPWRQPIRIQTVLKHELQRNAINGITVDVSPRGIGLLVPAPLASPQFYVQVPGQRDLEGYAGLAEVVHERHRRNGWFEIGASFVIDG